jgi:hypothetical protein
MIGEFFINGKDAHTEWGVIVRETSITALIEPEPLKNPVENKSATEHGKRVRSEEEPKADERTINLFIQIKASSRSDLISKLTSFKTELKKRRIEITTKYEQDVVYRCDYQSCRQTRSLFKTIATFSLQLNEPNPNNRGTEDKDTYENNDI